MKKNIKLNWGSWLAILAIIFSSISLFRCEPIAIADSWIIWLLGFSASISGVAITAAVAIQIYNSVVSESKIKSIINNKIEESRKFIDQKSIENRNEFLALLYVAQSQRYFIEKDYEMMLDILMRALDHAKECTSKISYNTVREAIEILIQTLSKDNKRFSIEITSQLYYKNIVSKINDKSILKIEKFIDDIETRLPELSKMPEDIKKILDPLRGEKDV